MIKVYLHNIVLNDGIQFCKDDKRCGIKVEGHSGWGVKGTDVVCSAVSAIIQTAIVAITEVAKIHQDIEQRDGFLESTITIKGADSDSLNAFKIILETMLLGLRCILDNYPGTLAIYFE